MEVEDFTLFDYLFNDIETDNIDYKNPAQVLKYLVIENKMCYNTSNTMK